MRAIACVTSLPLLVAIISACGGEGSAGDAYREAAGQAVSGAVLTLEDLPSGWAPSAIGEASYTNFELAGECAQLNDRGAGFPGEAATADSEPFTGPQGQELINTVSAFDSPEAAGEAVRLADNLVAMCTAELGEALKKAIQVAAKDRNVEGLLGNIDANVEPASFPISGDETRAYALKASFSAFFQRFEVNGHILVIRDGLLTGVLAYAALGDLNQQEEEDIVAALAAKVAIASEALAQ
jgi:hypothetical protein